MSYCNKSALYENKSMTYENKTLHGLMVTRSSGHMVTAILQRITDVVVLRCWLW